MAACDASGCDCTGGECSGCACPGCSACGGGDARACAVCCFQPARDGAGASCCCGDGDGSCVCDDLAALCEAAPDAKAGCAKKLLLIAAILLIALLNFAIILCMRYDVL